jgi:hypothetical protein
MEYSVDIKWPGHVPGRFYFGMARTVPRPSGDDNGTASPQAGLRVESYGVHRTSLRWGSWGSVYATLAADNARHRLSWISVLPPAPHVHGWKAVASGEHDEVIHELAQALATCVTLPALISFDDDPTDAADEDAPVWAAAYCRFHDIVAAATGGRLVGEAPIVSDWLFNPVNHRRNPHTWLTDGVLERSSVLGVTIYENASGETFERRIPRILDWLEVRGFASLMLGVAASGRTEYAPPYIDPRLWLNESLDWAARHTDRVSIVCYSSVGQNPAIYWPPEELVRDPSAQRRWVKNAIMHS